MSGPSRGSAPVMGAVLALVLGGCASTTECVRPAGLTAATPSEAAAGRLAEGAQVRWGGVLVETRNLRDRTELEVVGYPLDDCGRPRRGASPVGRFVIVHPGYLETAEYPGGRAITAIGRFTGVRSGRVGEAAQVLPLLESYKPRLWAEDRGRAYRGYGGPWFNIGIGGGSGGIGGGVGVTF